MSRNSYARDELVTKTTGYQVTLSDDQSVLPTLNYNAVTGHYDATCCVLVHNEVVYKSTPNGDGSIVSGAVAGDCVFVCLPSNETTPEPQEVFCLSDMGIDGSEAVDAILCVTTGVDRMTFFCAHSNTAALIALLKAEGNSVVDFGSGQEYIASVFTAPQSGADYVIDASAITGAGASLWGGDGADGERILSAQAFEAGTGLASVTPEKDALLIGVAGVFESDGDDSLLLCMLKIDGVNAFPVVLVSGGGSTYVPVDGRVHCPAGGTARLEVMSENADGGTVRAALVYAEV